MSSTHNILVISDLHLGEDLNPTAPQESTRDLHVTESQLTDFLSKYTRRRADGRPWRLVINGDMVDFLSICVFPGEHPSLVNVEHSDDEREHGFDRRRDAACAKVEAGVTRHPEFFRALLRFMAAGNAVEIICGNHDAEFCWIEVQEALRESMGRMWRTMPESLRVGALSDDGMRQALRFHAWFYYEPGVAWIEHGHQYDECCSFEYNLNPVDPAGKVIIANVDTAGLRYMTNQIPEVSPHGTEEWSFGGYLRFALGLGLGGALRLGRGYYRFTTKLISEWRASRVGTTRRARSAIHHQRLQALGKATRLSVRTLETLDSMQRPPVITNLRRLMQVLMLDRLLISMTMILAIVGMLALLPLWWTLALSAGLVLGTRALTHRLSRNRIIDATLPLQIVPFRILEHVDARFVVFGHTHVPIAHRLDDRRWYFNTGTWMPSGRPGILRAFTHVVIRHGASGPTAALCQWRDGASRAFTPERRQERLEHRAQGALPGRQLPQAARAVQAA